MLLQSIIIYNMCWMPCYEYILSFSISSSQLHWPKIITNSLHNGNKNEHEIHKHWIGCMLLKMLQPTTKKKPVFFFILQPFIRKMRIWWHFYGHFVIFFILFFSNALRSLALCVHFIRIFFFFLLHQIKIVWTLQMTVFY